MNKWLLQLILFITLVLVQNNFLVWAAANDISVPASLEKWHGWVIHHHPELNCSQVTRQKSKQCQWHSPLVIKVLDQQIQFEQTVLLQKQSWIELPGDIGVWPLSVELNGSKAKVMQHNKQPAVFAKAGSYHIKGKINPDKLPLALTLPSTFTFVDFYVDGNQIAQPSIDKQRLILRQGKTIQPKTADTLTVAVFRLLRDGNPLSLETKLELNVSGGNRIEKLGRVLPKGFELTKISAGLALRLDDNGDMEVALEAGRHMVTLSAVLTENISKNAIPSAAVTQEMARHFNMEPGQHWPQQEIWSFAPDRRFRLLDVSGAVIDGSQTKMPMPWQQYTSYLLQSGQGLSLSQKSRGDAEPDQHKLGLQRTLWLNFDGSQFTSQAHLTGTIGHLDRLSANPGYTPGNITINGQGALITTVNGDQGVELLPGRLDLKSLGQQGLALSVNPWAAQISRAKMTVNLAPGYSMFSVNGADHVSYSYLSSWDLWTIFIVILFVVVLAKRFGLVASLIGLLYALAVHEVPEAPGVMTLLLVLGLHFFVNLLAQKSIHVIAKRVYHGVLVLLALSFLPFAVDQARLAIYPQLEKPQQIMTGTHAANLSMAVSEEMGDEDSRKYKQHRQERQQNPRQVKRQETPINSINSLEFQAGDSRAEVRQTAPMKNAVPGNKTQVMAQYQAHYQSGVMVQTGPGKPAWQWNRVVLRWTGPVAADQQLKMIITPPWFNRSLHLARILLFMMLGYLFVKSQYLTKVNLTAPGVNIWLLAIMLGGAGLVSPKGYADDFPSQALLDEYYQRLSEPATCSPDCFAYNNVELELSENVVLLKIKVATLAEVAVPLPLNLTQIRSVKLTLNGKPSTLLTKHARRGEAYLLLKEGVHQLVLEINVAELVQLDFQFAQNVDFARYHGDAWQVTGIEKQSIPFRGIHLKKLTKKKPQQGESSLIAAPIQPLVRVTRIIRLGIDWTIETQVSRIAPQRGPINLRVPLLIGESVTSNKVKVKQRHVLLNFGPNASHKSWHSVLDKNSPLHLKAQVHSETPPSKQYVEVWQLVPSLNWHISYQGLDPIKSTNRANSLTWWPLAGDALSLTVERPAPVAGVSNSLDEVTLHYHPGQRQAKTALALSFRASQGSDYPLTLPSDANISGITMNGQRIIYAQQAGKVLLPLPPGDSTFVVEWSQDKALEFITSTAQVNLPQAANINITTHMPSNRWVLGVAGPLIGPAVLFWGVLLVIVTIGIALGRQSWSPLKSWQWALMGTGIATSYWPTTLLVVAWFGVLAHRHLLINADTSVTKFKLVQGAIAVLTLVMLLTLIASVANSLMFGFADMQIIGNGSTATGLNWYQDVVETHLPSTRVLSVPMWSYQILMLLWSVWLSSSLMKWLHWGWLHFSQDGAWKTAKPDSAQG